MLLVKDFKGHSGCTVQLFNDNGRYFISKTGSNKLYKSAEILLILKEKKFNVPEIYYISENEIHMQYINGIDMKTYILNATIDEISKLIKFIDFYIETIKKSSTQEIITYKLIKKVTEIEKFIDTNKLKFSTKELIERLPTFGSCGLIHGDLTLDNILFWNNNFYLIDANPTEVDIIEFDANKIRQDLECLWFIRDYSDKLSYKIVCDRINNHLKNKWEFMNDNYILIFMLMRILPYSKNANTTEFLIREMNKLWQS